MGKHRGRVQTDYWTGSGIDEAADVMRVWRWRCFKLIFMSNKLIPALKGLISKPS